VKLGDLISNSAMPRLLLGLMLVFAPFLSEFPCCCAGESASSALAAPKASCCFVKSVTGRSVPKSCCQNQAVPASAHHGIKSCCQLKASSCECAVITESLSTLQLRRPSLGQNSFESVCFAQSIADLNAPKLKNFSRTSDAGLITSTPSNRRQARLSVWRN